MPEYAKGIPLGDALDVLLKTFDVQRVAGTSAGAIAASLLDGVVILELSRRIAPDRRRTDVCASVSTAAAASLLVAEPSSVPDLLGLFRAEDVNAASSRLDGTLRDALEHHLVDQVVLVRDPWRRPSGPSTQLFASRWSATRGSSGSARRGVMSGPRSDGPGSGRESTTSRETGGSN